METVTLFSPKAFILNGDVGEHVGKRIVVNKGNTKNFPADLVDHWYVKAHGAVALATATEGAPAANEGDDKGGEDAGASKEPAPAAKPAKASKAAPATTPAENTPAPAAGAPAAPWQQK